MKFLAQKRRWWLWGLLFACLAIILGILAFGWNLVIVRDYRQMMQALAEARSAVPVESHPPWLTLFAGSLGFVVTLGIAILFFLKILNEMRVNQLQADFLATVTHELKTPLAAVELAASLIRSGDVSDEEKSKLWESHDQELQRLRLDVEALLDATRAQAGRRTGRSTVEIEAWLERSTERWRRILGPHAVLRRVGEPLPVKAMVDPRALDLITDNILDNARKYSKEYPEVTILTERVNATGWASAWKRPRWRIRFVDQGWGFNPKDSKKIFDRFFRSRMDRADAIPGQGLGLFIALSAGRSAGLRLEGQSGGHGQGATFTVEGVIRPAQGGSA